MEQFFGMSVTDASGWLILVLMAVACLAAWVYLNNLGRYSINIKSFRQVDAMRSQFSHIEQFDNHLDDTLRHIAAYQSKLRSFNGTFGVWIALGILFLAVWFMKVYVYYDLHFYAFVAFTLYMEITGWKIKKANNWMADQYQQFSRVIAADMMTQQLRMAAEAGTQIVSCEVQYDLTDISTMTTDVITISTSDEK